MHLDGRVAFVTGASRGIGRALAVTLAERGASVVVAARTLEPRDGYLTGSLRETVHAIGAAGQEGLPLACDLDEVDHLSELAAQALSWKGRVDLLVNNAAFLGKAAFHSLDELSLANWRRQLNVNLTAPLLLAQALVPAMRDQGEGVIVNITSAAADLSEGDVPGVAYGTTKAALNRMTLALARDLRADHISVFAVDPGYVRTEVAEQAAGHPGWEIDISDAHPPEVAGTVIADLVQRDEDEVSGRIWAVEAGRAVLRQDGREPRSRRP